MMILVTGGSGLIGHALIDRLVAKGERVVSISRHVPTEFKPGVVFLPGDILQHDIGIQNEDLSAATLGEDIDSAYHLAGIVNLSRRDKDGTIWETNVTGTANVIDFCLAHNVPHLYYCSTAYNQGRNPYERSKAEAEDMVRKSHIPRVTIFKPSIVIGTPDHLHLEHFFQYVVLLIKVHKRAEIIRRWLENQMQLPVIRPVFRIHGSPDCSLNMIRVDDVTKAMADINSPGTYWLTNPSPPSLREITEWVGEYILLDIKVEPEFKPTPIERMFERLSAAFQPYLGGDSFQSDIKASPIDKKFLQETVRLMLTNLTSTEL